MCGAQNAPHIGLSFIQICLHQHDLTKSHFFLLWENAVFSKLFCFLKALQKLFRFVILIINWNFQIIKHLS
nr:hypothetical protein [Enterococcus faecalis]